MYPSLWLIPLPSPCQPHHPGSPLLHLLLLQTQGQHNIPLFLIALCPYIPGDSHRPFVRRGHYARAFQSTFNFFGYLLSKVTPTSRCSFCNPFENSIVYFMMAQWSIGSRQLWNTCEGSSGYSFPDTYEMLWKWKVWDWKRRLFGTPSTISDMRSQTISLRRLF